MLGCGVVRSAVAFLMTITRGCTVRLSRFVNSCFRFRHVERYELRSSVAKNAPKISEIVAGPKTARLTARHSIMRACARSTGPPARPRMKPNTAPKVT